MVVRQHDLIAKKLRAAAAVKRQEHRMPELARPLRGA
jgi:hypothetical protein